MSLIVLIGCVPTSYTYRPYRYTYTQQYQDYGYNYQLSTMDQILANNAKRRSEAQVYRQNQEIQRMQDDIYRLQQPSNSTNYSGLPLYKPIKGWGLR